MTRLFTKGGQAKPWTSSDNARVPSAPSTTFGGILRATGNGIPRFFSLAPTKAKSAWSNEARSQTPPASKPQTRQTSCHHTARATKERRQVPRNSSPGCTSPGALGRGFPVAEDWGPALQVPNLRAARGAHSALLRRNLGLLPPATGHSDNPGTVAYLPAQPPPSLGRAGAVALLLYCLRCAARGTRGTRSAPVPQLHGVRRLPPRQLSSSRSSSSLPRLGLSVGAAQPNSAAASRAARARSIPWPGILTRITTLRGGAPSRLPSVPAFLSPAFGRCQYRLSTALSALPPPVASPGAGRPCQ